MNPSLTIDFSCLEEMMVVTKKLSEVYQGIADSPEAQGDDPGAVEFRNSCLQMSSQMEFICGQAKAYLFRNSPDPSFGTC